MVKKIIVLSLGGSLIVPNEIDIKLLKKFKEILKKHSESYKFVVVCGGGSIARKYIQALREVGESEYLQGMSGVAVTRLNARFMTYFFGRDANKGIPHSMDDVKNLLSKNNIVFCGALRYQKGETSDATSAKLARFFSSEFINLTKVPGLYDKDPTENKDAKFISRIKWSKFYEKATKIEYHPGQHFVLDQSSAKIIMKSKIKTYILGQDLKNLDNFLSKKKFEGTTISG